MKVKKMLSRLMDYFNADRHQQIADLKSIRKVLRKLKQKERQLKSKFNEARNDEQREALQNKLDVIYAQRTKGMQTVRALREQIKTGVSASIADCDKRAPDAAQHAVAMPVVEAQTTQQTLDQAHSETGSEAR
ncbi:MAG: hypothetical protein AB7D03_02420 [Thiomicrospira sp.]